jgi:hypothetical protein
VTACKAATWVGMAVGLVLFGTGCATNRGILDVSVKVPPNPASGKLVNIVRVTDQRKFEEAPHEASIPSLKGNEIGDKAITLRAIARKRNGYGKAIGDIVLPEGRTVEDVVREALTKSFREEGYQVADVTAAATPGAIPVEADIEQFWAWFTPGFWACGLEFEARVKITGPVASFKNGEVVRGYILLHTQAANTRAWMNVMDKGLENFGQSVRKDLAKP